MNFSDIWNTSQEDYCLVFVQQTSIVRFLLLSEQHGVKILITSFWDTQYMSIYQLNVSMISFTRNHGISVFGGAS